jgi:hypothetical protein
MEREEFASEPRVALTDAACADQTAERQATGAHLPPSGHGTIVARTWPPHATCGRLTRD